MASEQIQRHEVTVHPEDVQDRSSCHNPDYRVYLPETVGKLGLEEGSHVSLEKKTDSDGTPFIQGTQATEDLESDSVYTVFTDGSSRLRVTLPTDWIDEFIQYGGEEIMVVEVNEIKEEFRIYRNGEYDSRRQELEDRDISPRLGKPVVFGAAMFYETEYSETTSLREGFGDDIDDEGPVPE